MALTAGKKLSYKDPGGLFGVITVKEVDDSKVVLSYGGEDYTLREGQSHRRLAEGGRDYTNFELNTYLVLDFVIENTPAFFRQFQTKEQLVKLNERDIQLFRGEGLSLDCRKGMFAVFFPEDAHQPCVAPAEPAKIRKVVVKIHRSLLGKKGA